MPIKPIKPIKLNKPIILGYLKKPYGLKGWLHVLSHTAPMENLLDYKKVLIGQDSGWQSYNIAEGKRHGKGLVMRLEGIEDIEQAEMFKQCPIAIQRHELAQLSEGEFYWADLEGLKVYTKQGIDLGCIKTLYENGGLDVMVVISVESKERHIPFIWQDTIIDVDFIEDKVIVDWDFDIA